jgi:hypothetical protein
MKKVILLLLFMPFPAFGQIMENFESGNIPGWVQSVGGHWKADTTASISGKYSLHHSFDNSNPGTDQIGIPVTDLNPSMGNTKWSFMIRHGYDPSSSNNWCIFLLSDKEPSAMVPGGNLNGFAIGVNLTGNDDSLRLWKIKSGNISSVLNTGINWQNNIGTKSAVIINIERSQTGIWTINIRSSAGTQIGLARATEPELFNTNWFGLFYRYTSTCDRLIWLDDVTIDGVFFRDVEPPEVIGCQIVKRNTVEITLNEEPGEGFMISANFSLNTVSRPAAGIIKKSPVLYQIVFDTTFINKVINNLIINTLCDKYFNCSKSISISFSPVWAETGDVVISEVMADPVPPVTLPAKEYLELTNITDLSYNLKGWQLSSEGQSSLLPETIIGPGEYLIICAAQDTLLFSKFGKVAGVKPFPSLTDAGKCIILSDSTGNMIHGIEYSSDWYGELLKSGGGWSLELIDKNYPFYMDRNWIASVSRTGGTPGKKNSVEKTNPDKSFIGLINVFSPDSNTIDVSFSEPVKDIEKSISGIKINDKHIQSVFSSDPLRREFLIKPEVPLNKTQTYTIILPSSVTDYAGNKIERNSFVFGLPEPASKGEIVFNEILFNPFPGEADYIEFYNTSSKNIDAAELYLVSISNETGDTSEIVPVSIVNRCILPGTYYVITTDREALIQKYFSCMPASIFQTDKLPSMPDDKGHLLLYNRQLDLIDEVSYNEKMHYSLLSGYVGIALEKLRPGSLSSDQKNWYSASEASGWGTPGAVNSVYSEAAISKDKVILSSTKITPDNDGLEDLLVVDLKLSGNGNVVSVNVFDETGRFICNLANNLLAGKEASITWNGTTENGSPVNTGIYIIFVSVFDDTGKTETWKKVCTVIR